MQVQLSRTIVEPFLVPARLSPRGPMPPPRLFSSSVQRRAQTEGTATPNATAPTLPHEVWIHILSYLERVSQRDGYKKARAKGDKGEAPPIGPVVDRFKYGPLK